MGCLAVSCCENRRSYTADSFILSLYSFYYLWQTTTMSLHMTRCALSMNVNRILCSCPKHNYFFFIMTVVQSY
ncbi:hypothetical protein DUNSADRAFT_2697 [Dunaliella salina]|uniref:Encoded protein n=1 Tax=Dunaliella salina TaxID=3046 RepID=A0ABQ7H898_DUNSA|nr:hypothetical protein DUNSADRAFT_2697 [Dunaliella salina]|eukprot:KAF5843084.1 hypothetical protein DUNSADRAFT_2697 [Dunaliella salina]